MQNEPTIERVIELQNFLMKFQAIDRILYIPGRPERQENDVEHSYHLAMTAWFMAQYFPHLDRDKLLRYALAHDLVEVYAGDTYFFSSDEDKSSKRQREEESLQRIKQEWPDFRDLTDTVEGYESKASEEAKFIYALDKIMPIIVNYLGNGHGWHKHKVTIEMLHSNKQTKVAISPEISKYYDQLYDLLTQHSELFHVATN